MTFCIWRFFFLNIAAQSQLVEGGQGVLNSLSNLATSFCSCLTNTLSDITTLTCALVVTCFAQQAKRRVFLVCSTWLRAGLKVQIMAVLELPPKEGCSMRVNLESL